MMDMIGNDDTERIDSDLEDEDSAAARAMQHAGGLVRHDNKTHAHDALCLLPASISAFLFFVTNTRVK